MSPTEQLAAQLRAFFAGQIESLDSIARLSQDEIFRMIRSAIGKQSGHRDLGGMLEPQEICQYVYLTLLRMRQRSTAPPVHNVLAYLQRLINNAVLERRRRHVAQRRSGDKFLTLDPRELQVADRQTNLAPLVDRLEVARQIMRSLDPLERRVVTLRVHGWNWREIGARLGGAPDSFRAIYRRAIARVRRWFVEND